MSEQQLKALTATLGEIGNRIQSMKQGTDEKQNELSARLQELEQRAVGSGLGGSGKTSARQSRNPVAASLVEGDAFASIKAGMPTSGRQTVSQDLRAALSNPGRGQESDTAWPTETQRLTGIKGVAQVRLTLLDVLPVQQVSGPTLEYIVLDGYVNGANYQLKEGDEKAETDLPTSLQRAEIATIAHWLPASLQVLEDNSGLESQISQVLGISLRQKLEHELLLGAGGEGQIQGLIGRAQAFTTTATAAAVRVGQAITDLESAGWTASVIVLNPSDWFAIASERDTDGQYILGSPRDPSPPSLWGRSVVLSPSMPAGSALMFDASQVALLDRQQVTIEASRHDGSNFRRNMVTILAELRAGLAVYAPSATRLVQLAA